MSVATAQCIALRGMTGHLVEVQVDISSGMVGTTMVGRLEGAAGEARERVKMAVNNSAAHQDDRWTSTRRVTVLLSPADLPKNGTHYDVAIAIALLAAQGRVPIEALAGTVFIGELALSGALRPVTGVLPMVMAASRHGARRVFVPQPHSEEAALVPGMSVFGVRSLAQVVAELRGEEVPDAAPITESTSTHLLSWRGQAAREGIDLTDLAGMTDEKFALEVAAAGGHHLMLSGPRGSGKTSLAERLPTILPDLDSEQALELAAVDSLSGRVADESTLIRRPPFFAPHHDASKASLLGGGSGRVRPGEISRAHNGVLFLDEFPLFRSDVVESLRQPLESGEVTLARGEESATFPAQAMFLLAANPCPCGNYHPGAKLNACTCLETVRRHYRRKLSGPIIDRIDVWRDLIPVSPDAERDGFAVRESSAQVRERVELARDRQALRYRDHPWRLNSTVPGHALAREWPLTTDAHALLDGCLREGRLTRRGVTRVHRVAWTVADLWGLVEPDLAAVQVALSLRLAESLPGWITERAG